MMGSDQVDELIREAIRRLETDVRVGVGYNWLHVYRADEPFFRDLAINVLGRRGSGKIRVGIFSDDHYLHEFTASEEMAQAFWSAYDAYEQRLRSRTLDAYIKSMAPKQRSSFRLWPFGKSRSAAERIGLDRSPQDSPEQEKGQ